MQTGPWVVRVQVIPVHISSHILRLALLRLFAEAGACAGNWMSFVELGERWVDTGLRTDDLRTAVDDLAESGDLIPSERDSLLGFSLSGWALRSLAQPDGELQQASPEDEATLFNARYRARHGSDPTLRRRLEDQAQ